MTSDLRKLLMEARERIWIHWNGDQTSADCKIIERIDAALAEKVEPVAHSDDVAVDKFSDAMKVKLAKKRAEGRGGWDDPSQCSIDYLIRLFHDHVAKGDPVDIGNFAMMLWNRMPATSLQEKYKRIPIYAAPADQWRRVEDGLPDSDGKYLCVQVMVDGGEVSRAFREFKGGKWNDEIAELMGSCLTSTVTHWMPLPALPEGE